MQLSEVIRDVRQYAKRGWARADHLPPRRSRSDFDPVFRALMQQKTGYICALTYIADHMTEEDDLFAIKELAHVALGREWNKDGDPVELLQKKQ